MWLIHASSRKRERNQWMSFLKILTAKLIAGFLLNLECQIYFENDYAPAIAKNTGLK
jgi:hypothetical protein